MCDVMKGEKFLPLMPIEKCPHCKSDNMCSNREHNVYYCVDCFYTACMKCGKPVEICRGENSQKSEVRSQESEGNSQEAGAAGKVSVASSFCSPRMWLIFGIAAVIGIALGSCVDPVVGKTAGSQESGVRSQHKQPVLTTDKH